MIREEVEWDLNHGVFEKALEISLQSSGFIPVRARSRVRSSPEDMIKLAEQTVQGDADKVEILAEIKEIYLADVKIREEL